MECDKEPGPECGMPRLMCLDDGKTLRYVGHEAIENSCRKV